MANRQTLDPDQISASARERGIPEHVPRSIGPSDSSDSGSDLTGIDPVDDDDTSDRYGTGEQLTGGDEPDVRIAADITPDRIVGAEEAGLGSGLDQAEEAQLGVTDEELAERRKRPSP